MGDMADDGDASMEVVEVSAVEMEVVMENVEGGGGGRDLIEEGGAGYPGGPSITSLLTDYDTHIAGGVWDGGDQASKILIVHRHASWVKAFSRQAGDPPRPWYILAQQSGLTGLVDFHWDGVDHVLISAFVERWHADTSSFVFPWGEMTVTLHDVACLMGLPLDGRACRMTPNLDLDKVIDEIFEWTGDEKDKAISSGRIMKSKALDRMTALISTAGGTRSSDITSGMLAILLGGSLFIDKSGNRFQQNLLTLLRDHEQIGTYTWSAGVLACLYRGLGQGSRVMAGQLDGCTILLQAWIWYHFPMFRGPLSDIPARRGDPRYGARYQQLRTPPKSVKRLRGIRAELDGMTAGDVVFMPYGDLDFEGAYRLSTYRGTIEFLGEAEPYMPDRCARQFGRVQGIPLDPIRPIEKTLKRPKKLFAQYVVEFEAIHDHWDDRWHHLYPMSMLPRAEHGWDVADGYIEWLMPRIHPYVDPATIPHSPLPWHSQPGPVPEPVLGHHLGPLHSEYNPVELRLERYASLGRALVEIRTRGDGASADEIIRLVDEYC